MSLIKYRPDIDGLRAIAVILVIIFHMNGSWIPGGFIGVDVFFVISGYIITSAIYPQILAKQFSFNEFYVKRIKRILPLFYVVSLSSLVFSYFLYTPNDFSSFADSWRYASSFIANIYFERLSGYFAPTSETLPLLHTWSLSIEEQFYFVWPLALLVASKYLSKKVFAVLMVFTLFSLLGYSEFLSLTQPGAGYYLIQSRGFELLIGALLSILFFYKREKGISFSKHIYQLSGIIGFASLFTLAFFLDKNSVFPGINAFWVAVASAMIIFSGESRTTLLSSFLSQKPIVLVGRLSYSLYLWHWPVLAFYRYYNDAFTARDALICGLITVVLSVASWKLIENPLRHFDLKKRWVYLFYFILPVTLSIFAAKNIASNDGYPERFTDEALRLYQTSSYTYDEEKLDQPQTEDFFPFEPYIIGDVEKPVSTFIWGDSHGGHFRSFVDELGNEFGFSSLFGGLGGCPPLLGSDLVKHGEPEAPCSTRNNELAELIVKTKPSMVFIAGRWAMYTETTRAVGEKGSRVFLGDTSDYTESIENSRRALKMGLERSIELLVSNGITPVLFEQAPSYSFKPSNCLIKSENIPWLTSDNCDLKVKDMELRQKYSNQVIKDIVKKYPEVILIPVVDILCEKEICKSQLGTVPIYSDNNHLSSQGARALARKWLINNGKVNKIEEILK